MKRLVFAFTLLAVSTTAGFAQVPTLPQQAPNMPAPKDVPAEKVEPSDTGSTLSDKLRKSDGVIKPPGDATPEMSVPAPVPNPGTTPVIPPNPALDPK
ncbi:hypothetical protein [Microvirga antarctica]|uniref:hypothetical protein n=1 Tax=Microvirga antarctica TaxID=2819233 RepID=UPI001B30E7CA|nr:hypothetical protein [Microvirga antarctica]